jgi:hypothetical protein
MWARTISFITVLLASENAIIRSEVKDPALNPSFATQFACPHNGGLPISAHARFLAQRAELQPNSVV